MVAAVATVPTTTLKLGTAEATDGLGNAPVNTAGAGAVRKWTVQDVTRMANAAKLATNPNLTGLAPGPRQEPGETTGTVTPETPANDYFNTQRMVLGTHMATAQGAFWRQVAGQVREAATAGGERALTPLTEAGLSAGEAAVVREAAESAAIRAATIRLMFKQNAQAQLRTMNAVETGVGKAVNQAVGQLGHSELSAELGTQTAHTLAEAIAEVAPRLARLDRGFMRRFIPGMNVACAMWDVHRAIAVCRDPQSRWPQIIASGVTLLGSLAAATDLPVISWVGMGVAIPAAIVRDNVDLLGAIDKIALDTSGNFMNSNPLKNGAAPTDASAEPSTEAVPTDVGSAQPAAE